ncbi:TlpA family protein disulfide reductase [Nocardioides sp. ChNu-153]|uniref:TlpA family protein disulfide reductase n=1 Tax=unclassified Nocardioides TaxID=2615069 RepID=UPI00240561B2|nr:MULTISPECIES: TlpA disulfide reductase family protein [unclassified Nocardioides]MDF9717667.1 TlpA family protein disulfide reductase [Nocardioides sp. ChNu-99]MDN7123220.1 TlpA family protein disulfide reductase [Nocardioides sp. ChNu-153]
MSSSTPRRRRRRLLAAVVVVVVGLLVLDRALPGVEVSTAGESSAPAPGADVSTGWVRVDQAFPEAALGELDTLVAGPASGDDGPRFFNVWASWCGPCERELPIMEEFARTTTDVTVVGVSRDAARDAAEGVVAQHGLSFANFLDADEQFADQVGTAVDRRFLPASFLVENGRVTWAHLGEFRSLEELQRDVAQRLGT